MHRKQGFSSIHEKDEWINRESKQNKSRKLIKYGKHSLIRFRILNLNAMMNEKHFHLEQTFRLPIP